MNVVRTAIPDVVVLEPKVFGDARGYFYESFNQRGFAEATGVNPVFVQDNQSRSARGVLRGLHYQVTQTQGKLVRVVEGSVFDVAVDVRRGSPTLGRWVGEVLSQENRRQLWIPPGFAHGFFVLTDTAEFLYKTTDYYLPVAERCLAWNDPSVGIDWPISAAGVASPTVSAKDQQGQAFTSIALLPGLVR
ncbi:MAG: dTDP-4-dehydrorhamnose 3,5-epimerase [Kofleriaceae bacterium]|nr:dTDP-4-dehydrorhamnose 3,5-epimerase [Kofleriaceae bacterium]